MNLALVEYGKNQYNGMKLFPYGSRQRVKKMIGTIIDNLVHEKSVFCAVFFHLCRGWSVLFFDAARR